MYTHSDIHRQDFPQPGGDIWPRRVVSRALLPVVVLVFAVLCVSPAHGAVTHTYEAGLSKQATAGPVTGAGITVAGPASIVRAMAGDGGHVWLAEDYFQYATGVSRVDEFDLATGEYVGQLVEEDGVGALFEGVAVGHSTGEEEAYVGSGKEGQYVVSVFGADKKLQGVWTGVHTENGSFTDGPGGETGVMDGVAVDDSASLETKGDVYVSTREPGFDRVDVVKPGAGGGEGVSVGQITGTCASPGVCSGGEIIPFSQPDGVAVSGFNGDVLIADGDATECSTGVADCAVDVFEPVAGMPGVYSFLFQIAGTEGDGPFKGLGPLAVNGLNGNIYIADKGTNVVYEFDPTGKFLGSLRGTPIGSGGSVRPFEALQSVAVDSQTGDVIVGDYDHEREKGIVDVFGGDVVIPDVAVVEPPSGLSPHTAVLHGEVNPDGEGEAHCEFEYGTSTEYGQSALCAGPVANGNKFVEVNSIEVSGLEPDTTYHYRLDAGNANGIGTGECPADCGVFTTPGPGVTGVSAANITATSATLLGEVDPHGNPTSYYFQYSLANTDGCDSSPGSCTSIPLAPGLPLGSGSEPVGVVRHIQGLSPGTGYHYRLVAVSELHAGKPETFAGADHAFATQPLGSGLGIADGRQWQLVSPPDKHGAVFEPITSNDVVQAAVSGGAISYPATLPTEAGAQGYSETEQILSTHDSGGWSSRDISLPHSGAVGGAVGNGNEYRLFSEDLSSAAVYPFGEFTSLSPCVSSPDSERTPYIRHNDVSCDGNQGSYDPLLTVEDVPPGTAFGQGEGALILGGTRDLSHVVVRSATQLTAPPKAGETSLQGLYEWSAGRSGPAALDPVSVLPNEKLAQGPISLGSQENEMARGAISNDGSRVVWSVEKGHLYLRDVVHARTLQLDVPQASCVTAETCGGGAVEPVFQLATSDGSHVFFTDTQRLTADAGENPGQPDLYECDIEEQEAGVLACDLNDVTPVVAGASANVRGAILGASEDGSQIYFVANGALIQGASKGKCNGFEPPGATCNLYAEHRGASGWEAPKLVAVLGGEDWPTWKGGRPAGLDSLTARVSPNGRFVAFMSDRPLTGYDSRDANTGKPDQEVFEYDAQTARLVCASCNPTGARPDGTEYGTLRFGLAGVESGVAHGLWAFDQGIAANVPGWTSFRAEISRYQPRYLSNSGRLFFNSSDALVPQDVNDNLDVYEWEPTGTGTCTTATPGYSAATGGCVGLISSGAAAGESAFMDAGSTGEDAFFLTGERLTGSDYDTALDLYDAHECSEAVPCFDETQHPPPCTTADACRPPVSTQPSIFTAPASATFTGIGNKIVGTSTPALKPKTLTRAQKLVRALVTCRKHRQRAKRAQCERKARRRYSVRQLGRVNTTRKSAK